MKATRLVLSAFLALGMASGAVWGAKFETNPGDPGNSITFDVSAPLETIVGTSAAVKGHFRFDPGNVKASSGGMFVVDVAKFKTGIDLRDEHFRDNFLQAKKYPNATFTLGKITKASKKSIKSGESVELEIEGTMNMHGVKHKEKATATVTYLDKEAVGGVLPGNVIVVKASFQIALADYGIKRPAMLVLKVGEVVDIDLTSRLTDAPKMANGDGCGAGGCGGCGAGGCGSCGAGGCGGCGARGCGGCGAGGCGE
ncbi:MAG: YceI family protein [Gemmatimonadetes bacterium]|nr:YceI family protein [Gemmatimonadota bacterium]